MTNHLKQLVDTWEARWDCFFKQFQGVVCACSGGLDSTVLLHLLWLFCNRKKNFELRLLHLNYGLRGSESDSDQEFVLNLARHYQIEANMFMPKRQSLGKAMRNVQQWARDQRHKKFQPFIESGYLVACAHHQDDQCETVLLRLLRGSSNGKLLGMKSFDQGIWRPLLGVSRDELKKYAQVHNLCYRQDSSNLKTDYDRNFLRHEILPQLKRRFPGCDQRLIALACESAQTDDFVTDFLRNRLEIGRPDKTEWEVQELIDLPDSLGLTAISQIIGEHVRGSQIQLSRRLLRQICDKLKDSNNNKDYWCMALPSELLLEHDNGKIRVLRQKTNQKRQRYEQHRKNLARLQQSALIEQDSEFMTKLFGNSDETQTVVSSKDRPEQITLERQYRI